VVRALNENSYLLHFKEINHNSLLLIIFPFSIYLTAFSSARPKPSKTRKTPLGWAFFKQVFLYPG